LYFKVALGEKGADVKKFRVPLGQGIAGWVAEHNRAIISNDAENDKRHMGSISKAIDYPSRTLMAAPLRLDGKCVGVIELLNKHGGKPFNDDDLQWLEVLTDQAAMAVQYARNYEKAQDKIEILTDRLNDYKPRVIIAKSPAMLELKKLVDKAAKSDSTALILGESGVGKELVAEHMHANSRRAAAPFIRVNCAAIPEGLLESELFGHVKGAFTGATADRKGRFELADGGTIFLDEIGDMPLPLQVKLLRVLQERTFEKVGSETTITVDVRILAATNKDMETLMSSSDFRQDLFYRLNVISIYVAPLRRRTEDILDLAGYFLEKYSRKMHKTFCGFSDDAASFMLTYSWPGNIRELENCVERACVISDGEYIRRDDLFPHLEEEDESAGERDLKTALNAFKAQYVEKALREHHGNVTEAAAALDIQRTYLSKLVKELGVKP
jgi:Nif-specific regulatory protein